jgi:hypothetical protein
MLSDIANLTEGLRGHNIRRTSHSIDSRLLLGNPKLLLDVDIHRKLTFEENLPYCKNINETRLIIGVLYKT